MFEVKKVIRIVDVKMVRFLFDACGKIPLLLWPGELSGLRLNVRCRFGGGSSIFSGTDNKRGLGSGDSIVGVDGSDVASPDVGTASGCDP